jgi:ankyrin repeat protein
MEDKNKISAFFIAARNGDKDIMNYLVIAKANINDANINGVTPFIACAACGSLDAIKYMVENLKIDINSKDKQGNNALMASVAFMYSDVIQNVLTDLKELSILSETEYCDYVQNTKKNSKEIMEYLVDNGVDLDNANSKGINTFMLAVEENDIETANYLAEKGINISQVDTNGNNALLLAAQSSNLNAVSFLLDLDMDPNATNNDGKTPLMYAIETGNFDMINLLLSNKKTNIRISDNNGKSALMYACEYGYIKVITDLITKYSANINDLDTQGNTPLVYAVISGNIPVVNILNSLGADKEIQNKKGFTALDIAKTFKDEDHEEIVKILDGTRAAEAAAALEAEKAAKEAELAAKKKAAAAAKKKAQAKKSPAKKTAKKK